MDENKRVGPEPVDDGRGKEDVNGIQEDPGIRSTSGRQRKRKRKVFGKVASGIVILMFLGLAAIFAQKLLSGQIALPSISGGMGMGGMGMGPMGGGGRGGMTQGGNQQMMNVATVNAEPPSIGTIERVSRTTGTVESQDTVIVYAKASGDITSVNVKAGDMVQAGQILAELDTQQLQTYRNSLATAETNLNHARENLTRMSMLYATGDISDQEYSNYQNSVATAEIQYEQARSNLERQQGYETITAPISGRVEAVSVDQYDHVNANAQLMVLAGEGEKKLTFYVTERVVTHLSQGDIVTASKDGSDYQASITDVSTMADSSSGMFEINASLGNVDALAAGTTVKVSMVSDRSEDVMTVPVDAVYYDGGVGNVYLYQDGVVHKAEVVVGLSDSELAEIISGLTEDDMVISTWSSQLYEGSTVRLRGAEGTVPDGMGRDEAGAFGRDRSSGGGPDGATENLSSDGWQGRKPGTEGRQAGEAGLEGQRGGRPGEEGRQAGEAGPEGRQEVSLNVDENQGVEGGTQGGQQG